MRPSTVLLSSAAWAIIRAEDDASPFHPCPFLGAAYSKHTNITGDETVSAALQNITETVEAALTSGQIDNETTAFSITAFSASDIESEPFYAFHYTPPIIPDLALGVPNVTGNSVYRIGSVSKVLTVYTLLAASGFKHWQSPITEFIPELSRGSSSGDEGAQNFWDEVTIEALASHLSGVGSDYGILDISRAPFPYTELGLPEVTEVERPPCSGPIGSPLCSREQLLEGLKKKDPVFDPYKGPSYSNVAFQLLGYAIESITGDTFEKTLHDQVFTPLGMTHSSYGKPEDSFGVIPFESEDLWWNVDMGELTPAGAIYSSPNDLARLGRAILSYGQLSSSQTNHWLKPQTHTSNPFASVGAPWEILRYTLPQDPYRTIDIYSKSGGLGLYTTYLILVPDFDVGMTLNVAGSLSAISPLADLMTEALLPALEEAARQQAEATYSGQYQSTDGNYSFTLSTSSDTPGLHLTNFTGPEDSDMLATLAATALLAAGHYETASAVLPYFANGTASAAYQAGLLGTVLDLRLFPTMTQSGGTDENITSHVFRAAVDMSSDGGSDAPAPGPFTGQCISWQLLDAVQLGGQSFDRFVFRVDAEGKVEGVEHGALRRMFERVE